MDFSSDCFQQQKDVRREIMMSVLHHNVSSNCSKLQSQKSISINTETVA